MPHVIYFRKKQRYRKGYEQGVFDVLDKIRAEIAKRTIEQGFDADEWSISYNELMKIIDKYDTRKKVR